jgi:hypothetical protein
MQVQSKKTLNINDLLGTKAQGTETEASSTQKGEMIFSELLGDAVVESDVVKTDVENTEIEELNNDELIVSLNISSEEEGEETSSTEKSELSEVLNKNSNKSEIKSLNLNNEIKTENLIGKAGSKLQSIFKKKDESDLTTLETRESLPTELKEIKSDKKNFLNDILGKMTKAPGVEKKLNTGKVNELRIGADIDPALMKAKLQNKNIAGMSQYKKEVSSLNKSLVNSPIHSELIDNNKLLDENGVSKLHQTNNNEFSFSNNIEGAQSLDLGRASDNPKENFSSEKILDLSQIKAESKTALIKEVSNYIEQSYVSNQETVDLVVKHDELGSFRILAHKSGPGNQVDLEINTVTKQAETFFLESESELIKNLQSGGVKLSSVKVVAKPEFLFTMEGGKSGNMEQSLDSGRDQGFHGRGEQRNQGSSQKFSDGRDRRGELWQQAQEFNKQYAA